MADNESNPDDLRYEWDVYYLGGEGFAEHMRVVAPDSKTLSDGRNALIVAIQAVGAAPQLRDRILEPRQQVGKPAPQAAAAAPTSTPVCRECGGMMKYREGGTVKNPNSARFGQPYAGFYSCANYPNCQGRMNA